MHAFRQIFDPATRAFTYLLGDTRSGQAVVIDPGSEATTIPLLAMLAELDLKLRYVLQTHVHDTGPDDAASLGEQTGARLVAVRTRAGGASKSVKHDETIVFGNEAIRVIGTPGHTPCSVSYLWNDRVFTGDSLLIDDCGHTDPPAGDAAALYDSITRRLFILPGETLVFPGHDSRGRTVSTIAEQRARNPSIAGLSRDEFITRRYSP
jgi:sulfur dioxygenase